MTNLQAFAGKAPPMFSSTADKSTKDDGHDALDSPVSLLGEKGVTQKITLIILGAYIAFLFIFTVISILPAALISVQDKQWFDITKSGFTTLGSALTLIIGYYFGQKQVAEEVRSKAEKTITALEKSEVQKRRVLLKTISGNVTVDEPEELREAKIPATRRPRKDPV